MLLFTFTPPPTPQHTPTPCPACNSDEGLPLYATSRSQYYRCTCCRQIWGHSDNHHPAPTAA
jgi:hypothetical protein